jgi:hypothetical protein
MSNKANTEESNVGPKPGIQQTISPENTPMTSSRFLRAVLACCCLVMAAAQAQVPFWVGNSTGSPIYQDIPAQGFSPSVPGNAGNGTAPGGGGTYLTSFVIGFQTPVNMGKVYIFDQPYTGTPAALAGLSVGGAQGLLGSSQSVTNSVFTFGIDLWLPDVNASYYAYYDSQGAGVYLASTSDVYDSTTLHLYTAEPVPGLTAPFEQRRGEDIVFSARFWMLNVPTGTVNGIIYEDTNGNGTQDSGEPGLQGVAVEITDSLDFIQVETTNASGVYSEEVPTGLTTLDIINSTLPPNLVQTEGTDPTVVDVFFEDPSLDIDGFQPLPGTVTGRVYQDSDGNGTQDQGEPGLPGVDVLITDSVGENQTVITDANGDYDASVSPGSTTIDIVNATLPQGMTQTEGTDPTVVSVPAGGSSNDVDGFRPNVFVETPVPALSWFGFVFLFALLVGYGLVQRRRIMR